MTHSKKEKNVINPLPEGTLLTGGKQQYSIKKVLGQGSFGITYRATTLMQGPLGAIEIDVAVKEFFMLSYNSRQGSSVTYGGSDDLFMHYKRMFAREARNLSSLNHRNIVKVLEYFEANNTYYYVMEYCRGGSLNEKIAEKGHLNEEESLHYFAQLTSAVSHMHDHKMLHLDIKPDNIVLRENGELVLIDFGLSKQYTAEGHPETSTSIGLGTPGYAPIEQAKHRRDSKDFAATLDVYAVGATLFKMLTGQRPPEAADVMEGFPTYMLLEKGVNEHLIRCINKAMSLRTKRYPTIQQFVQDVTQKIDLGDVTAISEETDINDNSTIVDQEPKQQYDRRQPQPRTIEIKPEDLNLSKQEKIKKHPNNDNWLKVALVGIAIVIWVVLGLRACQPKKGVAHEEMACDSLYAIEEFMEDSFAADTDVVWVEECDEYIVTEDVPDSAAVDSCCAYEEPNVSIWVEAARKQLASEDYNGENKKPLNYQETMDNLEKEQLDNRLRRLRAEKESYDALVGDEAKNYAPTFGLR